MTSRRGAIIVRGMKNVASLSMAVCLASAFALAGCGKELGRIPFSGSGVGTTMIDVKGGKPIAVWTSLDVAFTGKLDAHYEVRVTQGSETATAMCYPLDVSTKLMSTEYNVNNDHKIRYQGKMRCDLTAPADGAATIDATLVVKAMPGLTVKDMSLVFKQ